MNDFAKRINEELRAGKGQRVGNVQIPEEHRAINRFLREGAAANTFETDLAGRVTHVDGEPVPGNER